MTVGLCLAIDMVVANFIEPLVLGKRTGVSAVALLISALFWTWLWGPFGLVLATPLTVCAAVMGRHVPALSFLAIALGDETGLNQEVNLYQRILARATKDAQRIAKRRAGETSLPKTFDELLIPALRLMVRDQNMQAINQSDADRVVSDIDDIVTRLNTAELPEKLPKHNARALVPIVGIPAESSADRLLLKMLERALAEQSGKLVALEETDRSGVLAEAIQRQPTVICIAALPPSGNVNARFLCRRLRAELPEAYILVLLPEGAANRSPEAAARLREAGANNVALGTGEATSSLVEKAAGRA